jgi:hypothetical protein
MRAVGRLRGGARRVQIDRQEARRASVLQYRHALGAASSPRRHARRDATRLVPRLVPRPPRPPRPGAAGARISRAGR